jgi:hypothetical protein
MIHQYILLGKLPVPCESLRKWSNWYCTANRTVAKTQVGPLLISTVFLGVDHQFGEGEPLLFETMIFDDGEDSYQTRCATWDEAEQQHAEAVKEAERQVAAASAIIRWLITPERER